MSFFKLADTNVLQPLHATSFCSASEGSRPKSRHDPDEDVHRCFGGSGRGKRETAFLGEPSLSLEDGTPQAPHNCVMFTTSLGLGSRLLVPPAAAGVRLSPFGFLLLSTPLTCFRLFRLLLLMMKMCYLFGLKILTSTKEAKITVGPDISKTIVCRPS